MHRNSPRRHRRPSGRDGPATRPVCRPPASARHGTEGGRASLPMSCRNGYHVRGMNDSTQGENWWKRLSGGLKRTSSSLGSSITAIVSHRPLEPETLDSLEDELVRADLGQDMAVRIVDALSQGRYPQGLSPDEVKGLLAVEIEKTLTPVARPLEITARPFIILVSGVNGSGKTTTIGKLAARFRAEGKSVMLVDTAGRLQNRAELMGELEKMVRVMRKVEPTAPHAVLLVLDATVGQNALSQVEIFGKTAGVTGLVMTKLDGTARGGILVAVADKFGLPVHFVGVGEGVDDLAPFTARDFARAVVGLDS